VRRTLTLTLPYGKGSVRYVNHCSRTYREEMEERYMKKGRSLAEKIAGGAGVALAIIGWDGIMPNYMIPISTIAPGIAFVSAGERENFYTN
jgi:hypothetical protein